MNVGDHPLPALRYDGEQGDLLQFTEYDLFAPSYGATFYVVKHEFSLEALRAKRDVKMQQFNQKIT